MIVLDFHRFECTWICLFDLSIGLVLNRFLRLFCKPGQITQFIVEPRINLLATFRDQVVVYVLYIGTYCLDSMKLLSRSEEFVLLAVWKLQEQAYTIPIRAKISEITKQDWSLGSVYTPLERLSKKGLLASDLTEATPERGGRRKRVYKLTPTGRQALIHVRSIEQAMWSGVTGLALEGGRS